METEELPGRSFVLQWMLHVVAMIALGVLIGFQLYVEHSRTTADERDRLQGHARMIAQNLSFELRTVYQAMLNIRSDPAYWTAAIGADRVSRRLKAFTDAMPSVRTINVFSADGIVVASNRGELVGGDFSKRDYFEDARRRNDPNVVMLSEPFQARLGFLAISLVVVIQGAHGEFSGAISATLNPAYLTNLLNSGLYASDMVSTIIDNNGILVLIVPERPDQIGANLARPGSFYSRNLATGAEESVTIGAPLWDPNARMVAMKTFYPAEIPIDKPLIVSNGRDMGKIFFQWRQDAVKVISLYVLLVSVSTCGLIYIQRRQQRFDRTVAEINRSLAEARQQADAASHAKSAFLASMSHEIRTPLNAVIGLAYLLEQTELTPVQSDYIRKTQLSAQSLLGILNDILDLSKVEAGRLELEKVPFRLDDLMKTVGTVTATNTRDKNIEVLFHISSGTPNTLVGDALRLQEVLLNLAGNAIKFTSQGEVVLMVEPVEVGPETARLAFSVRDTGVGIPPDQISLIFDPFTQADASTSRQYGGSGLGLAICKRLVALMGGDISVASELGRGSTFRFTANFGLGAEEAATPTLPPELAGPLRVLIADDNPTAREVMTTMVSQFGWRTTVAASGQEALAAIDRSTEIARPFDLVLLDWVMPGIGGKEVLAHIGHRYPPETLPVIVAVTGYEQSRVRREAGQESVIRAILTKPITPSVLLDAVSSVYSTRPGEVLRPIGNEVLAGYTLLLVEDNLINQLVGRRILENAGATVEVAASGVEALAALSVPNNHFDAVLMDIQMPGMDGYETCRRLREQPEIGNLPIIAMTANALPADREHCLAAGMNDHIAKPLDVNQAIQVILRHVCRPESAAVRAEIDLGAAMGRCGGDGDLLKQVMEEFIRQFTGEPDIMARQMAEGDVTAVAQKAHDLKTVAASIGATNLAKKAASLHTAVSHGELELARTTCVEVCSLLAAALASSAVWLAGATPVQGGGNGRREPGIEQNQLDSRR